MHKQTYPSIHTHTHTHIYIYIYIYIYLCNCRLANVNYTRMLQAILNKSWRQHPTRHQLYGHLPPITKTIQVRPTRHTGHCWRSRDELISDILIWTPTYGRAKAGRPARTWDVALKTCQRRWTIGKSGVRGSGISVLVARHDDDDTHTHIYIYIYIWKQKKNGNSSNLQPCQY